MDFLRSGNYTLAMILATIFTVVINAHWADGGDGSGKNMLGLLLMELREELKNEQ